MLAVQSVNFACTDFWSPYLMQMGAEIRVSIADVDSDPLLNWYWPPSASVHRGSYSETNFFTMDKKARTRTQKYGWTRTESIKSVFFRKTWPPLRCPIEHTMRHNANCSTNPISFHIHAYQTKRAYFSCCPIAVLQ